MTRAESRRKMRSLALRKSTLVTADLEDFNMFDPNAYEAVTSGSLLPIHINEILSRLSAILPSSAEDLDFRVATLIKRLQLEKDRIDEKLDSSLAYYLEQSKVSQDFLDRAMTEADTVTSKLNNIQEFCVKTDKLVDHYDYIKQVSLAHQNLQATRKVYEQFVALNAEIQKLTQYLDEELENYKSQADKNAIGKYLIPIHSLLFKLDDFRYETMYQVKDKTVDVVETLNRYFQRLEKQKSRFESYFWDSICSSVLDFLLDKDQSYKSLVVKILKIVELEESVDAKTLQLQQTFQVGSNRRSILKLTSLSGQVNKMHAEREIKSYKSRFQSKITEAIQRRFNYKTGEATIENMHLFEALEKFQFILKDLPLLNQSISAIFPETYGMLEFVVIHYHRNIHGLTKTVLLNRLPIPKKIAQFASAEARVKEKLGVFKHSAQRLLGTAIHSISSTDETPSSIPFTGKEILDFLGWLSSYTYLVKQLLGEDAEELLEPRLLEDRDMEIHRVFLDLARKNLTDWFNNLISVEQKSLSVESRRAMRAKDSETLFTEISSNGKVITGSTQILFQIINRIVDDILRNNLTGKIYSDAIREICRSLSDFQKNLEKSVQTVMSVYIPDITAVPDSNSFDTEGFEFILVALANNSISWIEYTGNLTLRIESSVEAFYRKESMDYLASCSEGFANLTKKFAYMLSDLILFTCRPAFVTLFTSPWYKSKIPPFAVCAVTIDDYLTDIKTLGVDVVYILVLEQVAQKATLLYLSQMKSRSTYFKRKLCEPILQRDYDIHKQLFSSHDLKQRIQSRLLTMLTRTFAVFSCSIELLFLDAYALVRSYPDIPFSFLEDILSKRDDYDHKSFRQVIENCREKLKEEQSSGAVPSNLSPANASLFSQIT